MEWEPIRGAANEVVRFGQDGFRLDLTAQSTTQHSSPTSDTMCYSIQINQKNRSGNGFYVAAESLQTPSQVFYEASAPLSNVNDASGNILNQYIRLPMVDTMEYKLMPDIPALAQLSPQFMEFLNIRSNQRNLAAKGLNMLNNLAKTLINSNAMIIQLLKISSLELSPDKMRTPAFPQRTTLDYYGGNLSSVLESICADAERKKVLITWLRELTPMDVRDLAFPEDPSGRIHLRLIEANGREVSAYSASDGTLRFLGMLAALLQTDSAGLYFIEEVDNGIHPTRLALLVDLLERQTQKGNVQIIATTHSPGLLNLVNDQTFENTSIVFRDEDSSDAIIRPLADLPNAKELRKTQGLGRLHLGGWMETALAFTENGDQQSEIEK